MEKGAADTSMNDVIGHSSLTKGGVYHHFSGKNDLLAAVLSYLIEENSRNFEIDSSLTGARERLLALLSEYEKSITSLSDYNSLLLDFFSLSRHSPEIRNLLKRQYIFVLSKLSALVTQGINEGVFKPDTNPDTIARGLHGIYDGFGMTNILLSELVDTPSDATDTALALINGISTH